MIRLWYLLSVTARICIFNCKVRIHSINCSFAVVYTIFIDKNSKSVSQLVSKRGALMNEMISKIIILYCYTTVIN